VELPTIATYPSVGGRHEAHGCVFRGGKTREVATNVYSRKTLGKTKIGSMNFKIKGSGVVFTHGEGISNASVTSDDNL